MNRCLVCIVYLFLLLLESCSKPEESVTEFKNGAFKVDVRSREFHHSGTVILDVCAVNSSDREFSKRKTQCFLQGYDFSNLSVKWRSEREIEISFDCGRVTRFTNYALVYPGGPIPEQFHATLHDACEQKYGKTSANGVQPVSRR